MHDFSFVGSLGSTVQNRLESLPGQLLPIWEPHASPSCSDPLICPHPGCQLRTSVTWPSVLPTRRVIPTAGQRRKDPTRNGTWHFSVKEKLWGTSDLCVKAYVTHRMEIRLDTGVNVHVALQRCFLGIESNEEWTSSNKMQDFAKESFFFFNIFMGV